jgi:hypothetical protein
MRGFFLCLHYSISILFVLYFFGDFCFLQRRENIFSYGFMASFFIPGQNVAGIDMTDGGVDLEATNGDIFLCARFYLLLF